MHLAGWQALFTLVRSSFLSLRTLIANVCSHIAFVTLALTLLLNALPLLCGPLAVLLQLQHNRRGLQLGSAWTTTPRSLAIQTSGRLHNTIILGYRDRVVADGVGFPLPSVLGSVSALAICSSSC